jgi:2-polyprenyl-6-methoxyphenol hydroxylase-like FAD-dependent oxidoreductase
VIQVTDFAQRLLQHLHPSVEKIEAPAEETAMSKSIGKQALVIGAGMGGLTAAAALSEFFSEVIVLERDGLPLRAAPRAGVPQGKHAHALLAGGYSALEDLFPGFGSDLSAAGAVQINIGTDFRFEQPGYDPFPQRDFGLNGYAMSRPLLEHVARQHTLRHLNIKLRVNCRVRDIIATADGASVTAVRCDNSSGESEILAADLVVDASGGGMPIMNCLEACGHSLPETSIGIDIRYATAVFSIPDNAPADWKSVLLFPDPRVSSRSGVLLPMEDGRWVVTLYGLHGDAPPHDVEGFMTFARHLRTPTLYNAIRDAELLGEIARFAFPDSVRRHFDRLQAFPRGLLPIGDAICRFNPAFGQGMSVAAQQACLLRHVLRELAAEGDPLAELAPVFFSRIGTIIDTPWAVADFDFVYPQTRGERPPDFEATLKFMAALNRLAAREPPIHKVMVEVRQLIKPRSVYGEPTFAQRVLAEMESM